MPFIEQGATKVSYLCSRIKTKNMERDLDDIDYAILKALKADARLSVRELAAKVHRSPTPVFERMRRLEHEGVIKSYSAVIDMDKLGRGFMVFCNVSLKQINTSIHVDFARMVSEMDEVVECYNVSGTYDYMLKVQVPDMKAYRRFVTDRLGGIDILDSVHSVFVMEVVKLDNRTLV